MAGEKNNQLFQIYGQPQNQNAENKVLHFGADKNVSDRFFAGLSMVLAHSDTLRRKLKLTGKLPDNDAELLREDNQEAKDAVKIIQAYLTSALTKNRTDVLMPALAEGLQKLSTQTKDYNWNDPTCCEAAGLLSEAMTELDTMISARRKLKQCGLTDETRSNIAVGRLLSQTMENRALAEEALSSDRQLTDRERRQYARDIVKADFLLELRGSSVQANNGEKVASSSILRDLADTNTKNNPIQQVVDSVVERNLDGAYKNLYSSSLKRRRAAIGHPTSMTQDIGQLSRRWYDLYGTGMNDAWSELYRQRTLARRRIRASIEEQKRQGKTSFQAAPEDVAWLIAEKVTTDEWDKAMQGGPANYDFLHLFADFRSVDPLRVPLFGEALKSYCQKQGVGLKEAYTENELLGDDLGNLYDENLSETYTEAVNQNLWDIMVDVNRENVARQRAEKERKAAEPHLSKLERHLDTLDNRLADVDKMLLRYQNVYGPAVDRDQEDPVIILVQKHCVSPESEYENRAFEPEDIAAFGVLAAMSMPESIELARNSKENSEIRDTDDLDWEADAKSYAYVHTVEDIFKVRANTVDTMGGKLVPGARTILKEGFEQLEQGNPEPLGRIIGENVAMMTQCGVQMNVKDTISSVDMSYNTVFTRILKVMDEHHELKESAMRHGMTERDLQALRAAGEYNRITIENAQAEKKLLTDAPTDPQELRNLLTACVTNQVMVSIIDGQKETVRKAQTAACEDPALNALPRKFADQVRNVRQHAGVMRTPIGVEVLKFGDPKAMEKLRKQISESAFVQKLLDNPEEMEKYKTSLVSEEISPESKQIAKSFRAEAEEETKRNRIFEARVRVLERTSNRIDGHKQDVLDVYGSQVRHFDGPGKDVKEKTQNLIHPETMYELPAGWTQKQIAALNVMTALSMGSASNTDVCSSNFPHQKEVGKYFLSCGIDPTMSGPSWTNGNLIQDLINRRPNSLDRSSGAIILNPARIKMKEALDAYINERNPNPLGEILGKTLTTFAGYNKITKADSGQFAYVDVAGTLVDLLNANPALKESARSFGLTDATLQTLSSEAALEGYFRDSTQAEMQLFSGKELSKEEFYDSMSGIVLDALVRRCEAECKQVNEQNKAQIKEQMMQKALPEGHPLNKGMARTAEILIDLESTRIAEAQTPGTKRFLKLSDPELKQKIRAAVEKNEAMEALRNDPEKLNEFRWALEQNHSGEMMSIQYTSGYKKNWMPIVCDPFLEVLDSCRILGERPLEVKCEEAERLLGMTQEELQKQADEKNIPLGDYIDRKETEKVWQERDKEQAWMRKAADLLNMGREQLIIDAYGDNVTVAEKFEQKAAHMLRMTKEQLAAEAHESDMTVLEKFEQHKQKIDKTAQRYNMSEEQMLQMAQERHTSVLTLSDQMNEEFVLSTAEKFHLSREQLQQIAENASQNGAPKTALDVADELEAEGKRTERMYEQQMEEKRVREETERRQRIIENRVRHLETVPDDMERHKQDILDIYSSRVQHFDNPGANEVKKRAQNLIRPETMYDLPEGWTQEQISALNVLTGLSMDNLSDIRQKNRLPNSKDAEADAYLLNHEIDRSADLLVFANTDMVHDPIIRRRDSLDSICGPKILNPARIKMKKALDAYINENNLNPLGEILGKTLTAYAGCNKTGSANGGQTAYSKIAGTIVDLLNANPALKESARSFGLTDATMATLSSEAAWEKQFRDGVQAERRILSGEKLSDEEFYDSMSGLVIEALVRRSIKECERADQERSNQSREQFLAKARLDDLPLDPNLRITTESFLLAENFSRAQVQTPGTKRFLKLSDPELKQKIREAVKTNKTINELRKNPKKLDEFRWALGNREKDYMESSYTKEYEKNWLPTMCDSFLPVLDSCKILEERPLDVKCKEAEKLLGMTRDALQKQADEKNIPLSDYIDQKETEKVWKERDLDQAWMRKSAKLLGMDKEQLIRQATQENISVHDKIEQYKQEIRKTAKRYNMSEEQFVRTAEEKHTDALTLSDQMNEEFILSTAEKFHLSRKQLQQIAEDVLENGPKKTVLDIADEMVAQERRAELSSNQREFDKKLQMIEKDARAGENVKQLFQLAKVVRSDVMQALKDGREDSPIMNQMRIPQNVSLDVLALCEQVLADREKNGNRPGELEQQISKNGVTDMIMKIHQQEPKTQAKVRKSMTLEKLMKAVRGEGFSSLLGVKNGPAALKKAAGVPEKPQNQEQKISPKQI